MVIPAVSIKWTIKDFSLSLGTEYMNSDFYHIGPLWLRFGALYDLYLIK